MKDKNGKIILDLCGGTGAWSEPYQAAGGYDVKNITLPQWDILDESTVEYCIALKPYGILCAPECTVWCKASFPRWKERKPDEIYYQARLLVKCLRIIYETKPTFWVVENPVGKMQGFMGEPKLKFDPCDYGDPYTKKTYLWGKFNRPRPNPVFALDKNYTNSVPGGANQKKIRGITPPGFAKAFFEANL